MAGSITSVNAVGIISIASIFPVGQKLQGFTADDIFDAESVDIAELSMGLDGNLAAGYVPVAIKQTITLQANSPSIVIFETWYAVQQLNHDVFFANGIWQFPSLGKSYQTQNGVLTSYSPISDAKKTMQPRKFGITWESITGVNV